MIRLEWKPETKTLFLDGEEIPATDTRQQAIELSAYIDGSVIEMFVNGSFACTKRFYYPGSKAPDIHVEMRGASDPKLWQMKPISPDRLSGEST